MKKIVILTLVLITQMFYSQANRFIYHVSMKSDSANRQNVKTENAYLDIANGKSVFYAENRIKRDSLISRMRLSGSFDREAMQSMRTNMDYIVEKNYKTGQKLYKARLLRDEYAYEEDRAMNWKILPETAHIGGYKTQKAETEFAGRTWQAWFTTEVPFQDGPYKFSGLPGLIVKVEDSKGDYSFDLKESKKIKEISSFDQRGTLINVKRAVFEKQQQDFRKDPMAAVAARSRTGVRLQMDPNQRKQMEERRKLEALENNNPIELK